MIEHNLRHEITILENQFGFIPRQFTMKAIFLHRHLMKKYRETYKNLYMVLLTYRKYDRILKEAMWWVLETKGVSQKYIKLIKDMY